MNSQLLRDIGRALYGTHWQTWQGEMADALGVNPRTVQRWSAGEEDVPPGIWSEFFEMLIKRRNEFDSLGKALIREIKEPQ